MYMTGDVDLPLELIEAHNRGRLVLFVGAGASFNSPSDLPLFDALAKRIGDAAHLGRRDGETVDHFLGRIGSAVDVHQQVRRIIGNPDSLPNPTHRAIAELAKTAPVSRIVTTNFDEHLEGAASMTGVALGTKYLAPALPVGRDFSGIAYIHGAVSQPAQDLILTDRDFGRAYLTDAWATRFLQQVFDSFTVLFIGYSHTDPIVSYLGLGLPSNAKPRFVLTHEPDEERWEYLGIQPIGYAKDEDHLALTEVLKAWGKRASMGRLEHRALVARLAQGTPPATPVERDYLIDAVEHSAESAATFAEFAKGPEWLDWVEDLESFKVLFEQAASPKPGSLALARWFADSFVADVALHNEAFKAISRLGPSMSEQLFGSLTRAVNALAKHDAAAARRWLVILATSLPGHSAAQSAHFLAYEPTALAEHMVLEQIIRPRLSVKPNVILAAFGQSDADVRGELAWGVDYYTVASYWEALRNRPDFDFSAYLPTFERALSACYELLTTFNGAGFDGLSFRRSAIEPHPQDQFPEVQDLYIDALRDGGDARFSREYGLAQRWLDVGYPLFQRLAVHLIDAGPMSDSDKISWILDRQLLWNFDAKHECFLLLKNAVTGASTDVRARLFAAIVDAFPKNDDDDDSHDENPSVAPDPNSPPPATPGGEFSTTELGAYEIYNLLVWLASADPSWNEVASLRDQLASNNGWGEREYPDLHSWTSSGTWEAKPPFSREQFEALIEEHGIDNALDRLLEFSYEEFGDGPNWSSAVNLVQSLVSKRPGVGVEIYDSSALRNADDGKRNDILNAIVQAWAAAPIEGTQFDEILSRVHNRTPIPESVWSIARFVSEQIRLQANSISNEARESMRAIATKLWEIHAAAFESRDNSDPSFLSLNAWPGLIGRFWVFEISARWQAGREDWRGLDDAERHALGRIISKREYAASQAAIPSVASEMVFLFNADPEYGARSIIPLFGGDLVPLSWTWGSFLYYWTWNDGVLDRGFYAKLLEAVGRLDEIGDNHGLHHQFLSLLLNVTAFSSLPLEKRTALLDELVVNRPELVEDVLRDLVHIYKTGAPKNYGPFWDDWLESWMRRRLAGLPRTPQSTELSAWADLIPFLAENAEQALVMMGDTAPPITRRFDFPDNLEPLKGFLPEYIEHLVKRIDATPSGDYLTGYRVRELIDALTTAFGAAAVAKILPAAAELEIEP